MLRRHYNEIRVGRIPTGYAVLQAEAEELYYDVQPAAAPEVGAIAAQEAVLLEEITITNE